jgi:PAS domain S-box-containing protein
MSKPLAAFLASREDAILDAWTRAVHETSHHYADRSPEEIRAHAREALACVRGALGPGGPEVLARDAGRLAAARLRQGFGETETVVAILLGRAAVAGLLARHVAAEDLPAAESALDGAFHRVAAACGQAFCALCAQKMTQDRVWAERRLEGVLEESADAIIFFDDEWIVRSWNRGAETVFGYRPEEIIGRGMNRLFAGAPGGPEEIAALAGELHATGHARRAEAQRTGRAGRRVWVDESYTTVRDPEGRPTGSWAVMRDLSDRHRVEEAKLQAERLALIGTMSAKLAHEIRNPLGSVSLNLDLLRDELDAIGAGAATSADEGLALLRSIESELGRVQRVIEDYLRFARLPSVRLRSLSINRLLEDHLPFLAPSLERQSIRLDTDLAGDLPEVPADPDQLWQALLNLFRNAIEAMPDGGQLTVQTLARDGAVICVIRDTGHGMDADRVEQMWKPFWSTKRGGTGLGMPLAQQIVAEHGGRLECESREGGGTVFTLALPVAFSGGAPAPAAPGP